MKVRLWQVLVLAACVLVGGGALLRSHRIQEGHEAFNRLGCPTCHLRGAAPSLAHVGRKYDRATLVEWLTNPQAVYARLGRRPLNPGYPQMPRQAATPDDIQMLSYYLASLR